MTDTPSTSLSTDISSDPGLNKRVRVYRLLTLHFYGALLSVYSLLAYLADKDNFSWWLIQCAPLLIFIPGLRKHHYKTYSWICFVTLLYFAAVVPMLMSSAANWTHWVQLVLICGLFYTAMMTSRWRQRQMIAQNEITY